MTDSFDLTTRPWIPCELLDGQHVELSTRDALAEAHRIRAIVDPSPLVVAVLHRHLLAVLHRSYSGPKTMKDWCEIAHASRFESQKVESYLDSVLDRMDLFHPTYPFAQTCGLAEQFGSGPIDELALERSSWGTARELFQHRPASYQPSMTAAEAARALLAHQAFATGGLVKKPQEPISATAAPLVRAAVVLLCGDSLFHTLISNLLLYDPGQSLPISANREDAPAWEQDPLPQKLRMKREPKRLPNGWLDMLTWLSRRIELAREAQKVVGFTRCVGQGMEEGSPRDPMVTYRADEKRGFVSIGVDLDKAFWRNADALFEAARGDGRLFQRPKTIDQIARPEARDILGESTMYRTNIFGLSAVRSRIDLVRAEHLDATVGLFSDPDAREAVEHEIRFAESAVKGLRSALYTFARHLLPRSDGDAEEQQKERWAFVDSLCEVPYRKERGRDHAELPAVWSTLGIAFEAFLLALDSNKDAARRGFEDGVGQSVRESFEEAISSAMSDGSAIKARAMAEAELGDQRMSDERTEKHPLIGYLEALADHENRATLAALRSSLREGNELEALRIVLPFLGPDSHRRAEDDAVLLGGLFALDPESGSLSLAAALRKVWLDTKRESVEKRFQALMGANRDDLPTHLRHAVSLVAAKKLGLNWNDLYRAIRYWDHPDDFVRRRWARSFWGAKAADAPIPATPPTTPAED